MVQWPPGFLSLQERLVILQFTPFGGSLRGEAFHFELLLRGQLRQVPDECHQLPVCALALLAAVAPGRPAGGPDSVLDDVEQVSIADALRRAPAQSGRARVESAPHFRFSATVV